MDLPGRGGDAPPRPSRGGTDRPRPEHPPQPPAPAAAPAVPAAPDTQSLRAAITQKYEVLAVSNGVVLKPRTEELGVRTIEVSGDTIAVNGERVSEGVLRAWLGEQAEPIVRLHRLRPAERQSLFGLKAATAGAAATGETEIPDTSASAASAAPADGETSADTADTGSEEPEATDAGETPAAPEAPEAPEEPESPSSSTGSRVKIIGKIVVDKDEMVEEAVAVLGSVRVDGEVAEDVVAVGGSVVINGKVGGSVVSVGRDVRLGPHAEVMGDVTSVGGTILREEGSKVHGSTQDVGVGGNRDWHRDIDIDTGFPFFGLLWSLLWLIVLALLIFLCLMLARNRVERAESYIATEPWKAAVVGLLAMFLFLPLLLVVTVLLVITIVGCALILLYPFIAVFLALLLLVGYTASLHRLGTLLEQRFDRRFGSPYAVALMGLLALEVWVILGHLVGMVGGFLHVIGTLLVLFGSAAHFAALMVGLGAVILDRLNGPAAAAVPPVPLVPPGQPLSPVYPASPAPPAALPLSEQWEEEERRWEEESEDRRFEPPPPPEG